jgi:acetoacetyl-CoA synthetase
VSAADPVVLWRPSPEHIENANLTRYIEWLGRERDLHFEDYDSLWRWSTSDLEAFWRSIWDHYAVRAFASRTGPA